jgi:putative FmdB family regulatory protein
MPLYEYECTACHRRTEKIQKFSDPELTVCPHCAGPLERTITAAAMVFKGGGWYADGYASHKPPASGESSGGESSGSSDGGSNSGADSSATLKASSGDGGKSESAKPAESSKPVAASAAPASTSSAKD